MKLIQLKFHLVTNKTILKIFYKNILYIENFFKVYLKNGFQPLKTFANFFLMCCKLKRHKINSIKVSFSHE